jgi:hypothetical protein
MITLQFTKNNILHSFVTQMFIDLVVLVSKFKKKEKKTRNKLGSKKRQKLK